MLGGCISAARQVRYNSSRGARDRKVPGVSVCIQTSSASSRTRAKQAIITVFAPARLSVPTQAALVAPLVRTSSTSRTSAPFTGVLHVSFTRIAPTRAFARALLPSPPSGGVDFVLTRASTHIRPCPILASSRPSSAAWLYPLRHKRCRCRGTGTISLSPPASGRRAAISFASNGASAILRPCLKPSTSFREVSV